MGVRCIVASCRKEWYPACNIIFHKLPSDPIERNRWISILKISPPFPKNVKVCSNHFKASDYESSGKKLKHGAIPFYLDAEIAHSADEIVLPLRDVTNQVENPMHPCKKPRLYELLNMSQEEEKVEAISGKALLPSRDANTQKNKLGEKIATKNVTNQSTSPVRVSTNDKSTLARIKTSREEALEKKNKYLVQRVVRLNKSVKSLKSLIQIVKSYASNNEIENIINGNFENICREFKKASDKSAKGARYSDEIKSFALTLHFYSAKAYEFLRQYVALPHVSTLRRSLSTFDCNVGCLTEVLVHGRASVRPLTIFDRGKIELSNSSLVVC